MRVPRTLHILLPLLLGIGTQEAIAQICTTRDCQTGPTVPTTSKRAAQVSLAPQNQVYTNGLQGSSADSYTTPAYTSADEPRSLSLLYASGMAAPTVTVQVDATDTLSTTTVSKMSLRLRSQATGAFVTFTTGTQEIVYAAARGTSRLAAQFDASGLATGAHMYDAVVRTYFSDGTSVDATAVPVRVLVINARNSPYGSGWIISGIQQVIPGSNGVFLLEGDGTARWFTYPGSCLQGQGQAAEYCAYTSPDGDFGRLSRSSVTGKYRRYTPDGVEMEFSADGRLTTIWGAGTTQFTYHGDGRLATVTDPAGMAITLGYDGAGKLAWIQDPAGRTVTTRVTAAGVLDQICDPAGCGWNAEYDASRRLSWRSVRGGARWDYEYDAWGSIRRVLAPTVAVDGQGSVRPTTTLGSLQAAVLPAPGTGTVAAPAARVLPQNVRLSSTDERNNTSTFAVDRWGNPTRVTEPGGRNTTVERDQHGRPTRVTAFNGDVTEFTYQGALPLTVRDVTNNITTTYAWTQHVGAPSTLYPYTPYATYYDYPLQVNTPGEPPTRIMKAAPGVTLPLWEGSARYHYEEFDAFGRPMEAYGPGGHARFFYAQSGARNLDSMSVYSGRDTLTTRFTRDGVGRVTQTVAPTGATTTRTYDGLNRVQAATDPGGTTTYTYATAGWLQSVTDPRGQVYSYGRNALGWLEWEQDPRSGVMRMTYDAAGRPVSGTNRRGQTVRYEYDALGQMTRQTTHEGAVTTYAYDPAGRWMAVTNAESSDTVRTVRGAAASVDQVTVRGGLRYVLNTRRDTVSNFSRVSTSWGHGYTHHFVNDHSGRVREVRDDLQGLSTQIVYNEDANTTSFVLPSGDTLIHGPNETRYTDPSASSTLNRHYWYDALQRVQQRGPSVWNTDSYGWDGVGQLEKVDHWSSGSIVSTDWYSFDGAGNPTYGGASVGTGNRLDAFDGYTLTYDADGNLVRKYKPQACIDWYYGYNSLGQLVSVEGTSNCGTTWYVMTFGYDGMGRRVRKTDRGVVTRYLYDGHHVVAETDAVGNMLRQYTWYEGVDRPHSVRTGGQTYYYITDQQGNVTGLVNSSGALVNRYEYNVWGAPTLVSEGVPNPLRYAGGYMDLETGLYNNRMRFYDPALQRFISEDPVGLMGGMNPYAYAGNDPVNAADPTGLRPCASWETRVNGECVQNRTLVLDPICSCEQQPSVSDNLRALLHARRAYIIDPADEAAYMAALDEEAERRQMEAARAESINAAVRSARQAADVGVSFLPGASTVHDASIVFTGYNAVTGDRVGLGGRSIAMIGMVTPIGSGQIRGGYAVIQKGLRVTVHATERMGVRHVNGRMIVTALQKGTRFFDNKYGTIAHVLRNGFGSGKSLTVWYDPIDDIVTSVLRSNKNPIKSWYDPLP